MKLAKGASFRFARQLTEKVTGNYDPRRMRDGSWRMSARWPVIVLML